MTARRLPIDTASGVVRPSSVLGPAYRWLALVATVCLSIGSALADDRSLDRLFDELRQAASSVEAAEIESRIWTRWLEAPDAAGERLLESVLVAMNRRDHDTALDRATLLVERYPDYAEAWNKRATIHYLRGEYARSVADIEATLELEPRHFGAISGLGLIFLRRGDPASALEAFRAVLEISPRSANARRSVAAMRRALGDEI